MWLANAERSLYDYKVTLAVFMIEVEQLLKPVSAEEPCGKDLSYDPNFLALEGLIAGKRETQFSAAEEPDWKAVHDACLALLGQSKDLRVAVILCLALLKLEGAVGLRDGLALLKGSLERYWPELYPKLDPEENNDPLERINVIASISTPWVPLATRCVSCSGCVKYLWQIRRKWDGLASQISWVTKSRCQMVRKNPARRHRKSKQPLAILNRRNWRAVARQFWTPLSLPRTSIGF